MYGYKIEDVEQCEIIQKAIEERVSQANRPKFVVMSEETKVALQEKYACSNCEQLFGNGMTIVIIDKIPFKRYRFVTEGQWAKVQNTVNCGRFLEDFQLMLQNTQPRFVREFVGITPSRMVNILRWLN